MENIIEISEDLTFIGRSIMELIGDSAFLSDPTEGDKCWVNVPDF